MLQKVAKGLPADYVVEVHSGRNALASTPASDLNTIGELLFTKYVFAFEITSLLLTIAVVGAVVMSRKAPGEAIDLDEFPAIEDEDEPQLEEAAS